MAKCGAKARHGGKCKGQAMQNGRCRMHGGKNEGPPRGSANAKKHGLYSACREALTDDEKEAYDAADVSIQAQTDDMLRLTDALVVRALNVMRPFVESGVEIPENIENALSRMLGTKLRAVRTKLTMEIAGKIGGEKESEALDKLINAQDSALSDGQEE